MVKRVVGQSGRSQRQLRVGEEVRHLLASFFQRGEASDPVLQSTSMTVTEVRISPDLRQATVFVVPLGGGDTDVLLKSLKSVAPFFKHLLSKEMNTRVVPRLSFMLDDSFDKSDKIHRLMLSIKPLETHDDDVQ